MTVEVVRTDGKDPMVSTNGMAATEIRGGDPSKKKEIKTPPVTNQGFAPQPPAPTALHTIEQ